MGSRPLISSAICRCAHGWCNNGTNSPALPSIRPSPAKFNPTAAVIGVLGAPFMARRQPPHEWGRAKRPRHKKLSARAKPKEPACCSRHSLPLDPFCLQTLLAASPIPSTVLLKGTASQAAEKVINSERLQTVDATGSPTSDLCSFFDSLPCLELPPKSTNSE